MNDSLAGMAKIIDVLFNGRPADNPAKPTVTIQELIKRTQSTVRVGKKMYRVTVEEIRK